MSSLALQLGGLGGSLGAVRLAERASFAYGWFIAVLAVLLATALTVGALRRTRLPVAGRPPLVVGPAAERLPVA
ncbi:hypothetical protein [Micromonospora sp. NPDC049679]|uniref:hypothetical protein n=1 Tax=Micromonospora sp. NPDC049679 TaxID=3155920 RepID=UPI0033F63734